MTDVYKTPKTRDERLAAWGEGPWIDEPDRLEFKAHGLPCMLIRNGRMGNWCGYAAVLPGHPLHGSNYDVADLDGIQVHGGLTYSDPEPGEPDDVWWFGFDCAHGDDVTPGLLRRCGEHFRLPDSEYCDVEYVKRETEELARQLAEVAEVAS